MNIQIQKPELEQRVLDEIQRGHFRDVDELLAKALDALREKDFELCTLRNRRSNRAAVQRMIQFSKENTVRLPPGETVEDLVRESHRY